MQLDGKELLMLENPHHEERSRIANHSHLLGVESEDQLVGRLSTGVLSSSMQTAQIPLHKRALGLEENLWLNLPVLLVLLAPEFKRVWALAF